MELKQKRFIECKIEELFKFLYTESLLKLKLQKNYIANHNLMNSGAEQQILKDMYIDLIQTHQTRTKNFLLQCINEYNIYIINDDIKSYICIIKENTIKYIDKFHQDFIDYLKQINSLLLESSNITFNNLKCNCKSYYEKLIKEFIMINDNKRKKRIDNLLKFSIPLIFSILSLIVTIFK